MRLIRLGRNPVLASAAMLVFAVAPLALGQQHPAHERGFVADKVFALGQMEDVNMFNLNLMLSIPIGQHYPVSSALSYRFQLSYNTKLWDYVTIGSETGAIPNPGSNAGFGWKLSLGEMIDPGGFSMFESPGGAIHTFHSKLTSQQPAVANVSYTRDGSHLRLRHAEQSAEVDSPDGSTFYFEKVSGNSWRLTTIRDSYVNAADIRPNYLAVTYSGAASECEQPHTSSWVFLDTHGRRSVVCFKEQNYGDESVPMVTEAVLPAYNDPDTTGVDVARYVFNYEVQSIQRGHPSSTAYSFTLPLPMLASITLPDSTNYEMEYFASHAGAYEQGNIQKLTLPSGGDITWEYGTVEIPSFAECYTGKDPISESPGVSRRIRTGSGTSETWKFGSEISDNVPSQFLDDRCALGGGSQILYDPPPEEMRNWRISPKGDKTNYYYSVWPGLGDPFDPNNPEDDSPNGFKLVHYGLPFTQDTSTLSPNGRFLSSETFADCDLPGDCPSPPVRRRYVTYERDPGFPAPERDSNRRLQSEEIRFVDDGNKHLTTQYTDFDGLGHYRNTSVTSSFPNTPARTVSTQFNPGTDAFAMRHPEPPAAPYFAIPPTAPWILSTFSSTTVTEGSYSSTAEFCFNSSTGFLNRKRILGNPVSPQNDVLVVYTPSATKGEVEKEAFYGAEKAPLPSGFDTCNTAAPATPWYSITHGYQYGSLASSQYGGMPFKSLDLTIDQRTGLPIVSRDTAGLETTYRYDLMSRVTRVEPDGPAGVTVSRDARLEYQYDLVPTPPAVIIRSYAAGTQTELTRRKLEYDGLGRPVREIDYDNPGGVWTAWNVRERTYDGLGRIDFQSTTVPYQAATVTTGTSYTYDPFGRVLSMTRPDGSTVTHSYTGSRIHEKRFQLNTDDDVVNAFAKELFDGLGRLVTVEEGEYDGSTDDATPTVLATTNYGYDGGDRLVTVTQGAQTRTFGYDPRGFLVSETHPESGTTTYSIFDPRGHAWTIQKPDAVTLNLTYDKAERVTHVRKGTGLRQRFDYATSNAAGDYRLGKLLLTRRNNVNIDGTITVDETYVYGDREGRVSNRTTSVSGLVSESFTQSFTSDDLGGISTLTYPDLTSGGLSSRTVNNTRPRGLLETVTFSGKTSTLDWHQNGQLKSVTHGDGSIDRIERDPDWVARPSKISTEVPCVVGQTGDTNGTGCISIADIFYLINYFFAGGPAPIGSGDVNGNGSVEVGDIFYFINYLFAGGPPPVVN